MMIVRYSSPFYILYKQHDHALLSGEVASHWGNEQFSPASMNEILTASLHDLSWIEADKHLLWYKKEDKPYDFVDYPLKNKCMLYKKGIDELEKINPFTALLVSKHYASFLEKIRQPEADQFLMEENLRREKLSKQISLPAANIKLYLKRLQLWDKLSLFVCLNKPGVSKNEEHPWYKSGLTATDRAGNQQTIQLEWQNERTVTLDPFPFKQAWSTTIPYYQIRKTLKGKDPDAEKPHYQPITFTAPS